MKIAWFLFASTYCATLVAGLDLGPIIRIAECRAECLRKHSVDDNCNWSLNHNENDCSECWLNCKVLENMEESVRTICDSEQYKRSPGCQTACTYRKTRVAEKYEPSMLPAPSKAPISIGPYDVAIVMCKTNRQWREGEYYNNYQVRSLKPLTWIIVVSENGPRHYSGQEWTPTLESLKEGPLYEATISWRDMQSQLREQKEREQKNFNDRVRQFFLEKYGEKVLTEWRGHDDEESRAISREVFRRFFFKRRDDGGEADRSLETTDGAPSTGDSFVDRGNGTTTNDASGSRKKESFVVSWVPETGGLTGNQVTDGDSAQISLLPGTKYLVRIASNDGPGSFPIVVDTRPAATRASSSATSSPSTSPPTTLYILRTAMGIRLTLGVCELFYITLTLLLFTYYVVKHYYYKRRENLGATVEKV